MMANKIILKSESKSMLNFVEIVSNMKFCIMKENFKEAFEKFLRWREDFYADNFSSRLFLLLSKADYKNTIKFLKGFPDETIVFLLWQQSHTEQEFLERWGVLQ